MENSITSMKLSNSCQTNGRLCVVKESGMKPSESEFHCWLDPIIKSQAEHYNLSVPKFKDLMHDAAKHQEQIEEGCIDEDN